MKFIALVLFSLASTKLLTILERVFAAKQAIFEGASAVDLLQIHRARASEIHRSLVRLILRKSTALRIRKTYSPRRLEMNASTAGAVEKNM